MRPGSYEEWVRLYDTITPADRAALQKEEQELAARLLVSVVLPVYNPELDWLREAIASVKAQTWSRWELCVADDASTDPRVRPFLEQEAANDDRIKLVFRPKNGHISACSNSALALATGDWCGLLDQDDLLAENALTLVAREINAHRDAGLIYSDEDFLDAGGARCNPFLKPDWNPELFLGQNYLNHFSVYRTDLLREIGGLREGFEGSQDYDLALRSIERLRPEQVRHIPRILYHWRMVPGSLAEVRDAKPYAKDAARRALADHVRRGGIAAEVTACPENIESHRVTYAVPDPAPLVSVIVYGGEGNRSHGSDGTYSPYEIVKAEPRANFAETINRAAQKASGSVFVFLHCELNIVQPQWLHELVGQALRGEVGAVGARVWSAEGTLRHSGFLLGVGGIATDAHYGLPRGHPGFFNRTFLQRNCSAVSAMCFAVRASVFRELGGFDQTNLVDHFHDIDFCLRATERGLQIVWTPSVNPIDHRAEIAQAVRPEDQNYMQRRWVAQLARDPYYSPNLSLELPPFELAFPPRLTL